MEKIQLFLLILQVVVAILMIILVLVQKSDGDSLSGIGGANSNPNSVMSSKASASMISKITMSLAAIFMINCLVLASISNSGKKSIQEDLEKIVKEQEAKKAEAPSAPEVE